MRSASTTDRTEQIQRQITSPNCRSAVKLLIDKNKDGNWEIINDVDIETGYTWSESGKKEQYANYSLVPLCGQISFKIINENGKYSDGSGTSFEGIIDKETKVRLSSGTILTELGEEATESVNLNDTSGLYIGSYFYHTSYNGSYTTLDSSSLTSTPGHFKEQLRYYDAHLYDSTKYALDAYTVNTYDQGGEGWQQTTKITVNCNTTVGNIYYRGLNDYNALSESFESNWIDAGATVNGDKDITVSLESRYIQVAVLFDGVTWADDLRVNSITITYQSYVEWIYNSVYYLDRPSYTDPKAPEIPVINCNGRDAYKRAVDTDINLRNFDGGVSLEQIVKEVCDNIGIKYNLSSISISDTFPYRTLTGGVGVVKATKVFEYVMQVINTLGYQMYLEYDDTLEDNIMYVQPRPTVADASGALNYQNYESIGDVSKNTDRIIQRMSVFNESTSKSDEGLLNGAAGTDFTTTGSKSISWSTGNREYKRIVVDKPEDITISNFESNPGSVTFNIDAITGTVNIKVYGSAWSETPTAEGEAFGINNHIINEGITATIINPLILTNAECKNIAESYVTNYENPTIEARGLRWPYLNLLPQLNDQFMLWRRFIYTNDVFYITKVTHRWSSGKNPRESTTFNLEDTGFDRDDPKWDDGTTQWDKGWIWDMGISTPLDTQEEIDAASDALAVNNVDMVANTQTLLASAYTSSGTDALLSSPSPVYDGYGFFPAGNNNTLVLSIENNQWVTFGTSPGVTNEYTGVSSLSAYGSIFFAIQINTWNQFAPSSTNGLKRIYLSKNSDSDYLGGYIDFYYNYEYWLYALNGQSASVFVYIAQNGSVYKGSISNSNLIVRWDGQSGPAGAATPDVAVDIERIATV